MESRESIDLDLSKYLLAVKRHWLLAAFIFLVTVSLSALATTKLKPSYEAEGKLLFRIPNFDVLGANLLPSNSDAAAAGDLRSLVSTQNPINTQMEVINSPNVLGQTIKNLQLKDKKGELLPIETLKSGLKLKIVGGTDVLQLTYKSRSPKEAADIVNTVMKLYLENDVQSNRHEAESTRKFTERQLPKMQADVLQGELALRRFKQKYSITDLTEETKSIIAIIGALNTEINTLSGDLSQVNAQTDELRRKIGLNSQEAIIVSSLSQSRGIQAILLQLEDTERKLATERSRFADNNPTIVNLIAQKNNLNILLQEKINQILGSQTQVPPKFLQTGELKQSLILSFLQSQVQGLGLRQKFVSLYNSRINYEQRAKIIPRLEQIQRELQRKLDVAQSTYQTLLKKVQELQVAENQNTASARIIALAEIPEKPASGQKPIILLLGVLVGGVLSTSSILFMEMRDRSLKTLKEVKEIFGYTLLGVIPLSFKKSSSNYPDIHLSWLKSIPWLEKRFPAYRSDMESKPVEISVIDAPLSLISEMYRMIQANLRFLSSDKVFKTIVITSAISQEGKSTVAANLGAAIAQLGRKVLLIDSDMRFPSQGYIWQIDSKMGLSDVLVGDVKSHVAICQVIDNLSVLVAGVRPPNPLALLDSQQMASLIENFSHQYDFVIIDAPPVLLAPDALTLGRMTDGILLVARPGLISSSNARVAKDMLDRTNCHILGLIVNGVIEKNESDSYFYHPKEYITPKVKTKKELKKVL